MFDEFNENTVRVNKKQKSAPNAHSNEETHSNEEFNDLKEDYLELSKSLMQIRADFEQVEQQKKVADQQVETLRAKEEAYKRSFSNIYCLKN